MKRDLIELVVCAFVFTLCGLGFADPEHEAAAAGKEYQRAAATALSESKAQPTPDCYATWQDGNRRVCASKAEWIRNYCGGHDSGACK